MMNSSSSNSQSLSAEDVESFLYQDASAEQALAKETPARGDGPVQKAKRADDTPRISDTELSRIVLEARADGLREGEKNARASLEAEATEGRKKLGQLLADFQREREEYYSKVEKELVRLALSIASKILHREAQVDPMLIAGIVKVAVEKLQQNSKVSVRVSGEDLPKWQQYFSQTPNIQIIQDSSLKSMDCVLETESGSAVMSVDAQLKEIETGFFDLLAQRPTTK
jgi:flagellar assembly protein FliH